MPEVDRVLGNEEKISSAAWASIDANEKSPSATSWRCRDTSRCIGSTASTAAPAPCSRCRTAAITAAPFALFPSAGGIRVRFRADRCGGAGAAAGGERLSRDRSDRRRYHELRRELCRMRRVGRAGEENPQRRAGITTSASVLDRFGRGRRRSAGCVRQRAAVDAASASVVAGGRRPDPQAHETPTSARRRHRVLRPVCGGCGRMWCSAAISSPASRPRPKRCLPARSIWSTSAG